MKEMFSLLYDEQKKLYNTLLVAFLIAPTGALLQIGGGRWDVAPYI
jgi:hypothetical protein